MSERVKQLSSRIVQITDVDGVPGCAVWALCEDGSLWALRYDGQEFIEFANVHPPHNPSTKAADFAEALTVLSNLLNCAEPNSKTGWEYYKDAEKFLDKHGA